MSVTRFVLVAALAASACRQEPPPKEYPLTGQILAIRPETQEVVVKHDDIPGFMMAMTMPYKVSDPQLLRDSVVGDLITATLAVGETTAVLSAITKTGHEEVVQPSVQPEVSASDLLAPGDPLPEAALIGDDGAALSLSTYRGRPLALTFIYTRCPDPEFCPLMDRHFLAVQKAVQRTPGLERTALLSITFDPDFDTPAVLRAHARTLGADPSVWRFATGTRAELTALARRFGVTVSRNDDASALVHNLATAVFDAEGRLRVVHTANRWTPEELIADLKASTPGR